MKFRLFCILTVIAVMFCGAGCTAESTGSDSLYDLIISEEESSAAEIDKSAEDTSAMKETTAVTETEKSEKTTTEAVAEVTPETSQNSGDSEYTEYWFRTKKLRDQHYEKHGIDMGFTNADDYRKAASDVVNSPDALHKTEKEDGDDIYYIEETNEFVVVSKDGYLRTYFKPDKGKAYYDKQ